MFETDRLPESWPDLLNRFDAVWVPSEFNRETFVRSGVEPARLAVVPGGVDTSVFTPPDPQASASRHPGLPFDPASPAFRFLSVFDWTLHKGWDVLLEAFAAEFGADPGVELWIKTWSSNHYDFDAIRAEADACLRRTLGEGLDDFPNLHLWQCRLSAADLPRLYQSVHAFVLPTRGEGWCRPLMEAMACGLPTIATAWSGLTAFHHARVGYPLASRLEPVSAAGAAEVPAYRGHCWAEPDRDDLRRLLRRLVASPEAARRRGAAARRHVARHFSRDAVTARVCAELERCRALRSERPEAEPPPPPQSVDPVPPQPPLVPRSPAAVNFAARLGRPLRIVWEGDQSLLSSLALVNREYCHALAAAGDVEISLRESPTPWHVLTEEEDPRLPALLSRRGFALSGPPDVTVRHRFPPDWQRPAAGGLLVIQPWEYGFLPETWVAGARQADEVWAYSRWVRDVYVRSGVPAEKVHVVPLGFDPSVFHPDGPATSLEELAAWGHDRPDAARLRESTRFLFVGGALDRKGADLLLAAFRAAFRPGDPVCLIVKDMGTRTFYRGGTFAADFRRAQADRACPPVLYGDADLPPAGLAGLYRTAHCLVQPYRGEGFALPPLEAMACGVLPLVPAGGPSDDYTDDATAVRIPSRRRERGGLHVGLPGERGFDCVGDPWQLEPDFDALVAALRWVHAHPGAARERAAAGRAAVRERWTWERANLCVRERLAAVAAPAPASSFTPSEPWPAPPSPRRSKGRQRPSPPAATGGLAVPRRPLELSLCMIVRDEEPRLAECLDSARPFVDEIVVVDTGSRDRTRQVARDCGARVFQMPWPDSFAAARNESLRHAVGRWIFWMDADDVLPHECGAGLRPLIRQHPRREAAFHVAVRIPPGPEEYSEQVVDHVKLFPNRPDLRFEHRIHEQILPSLRQAGIEVHFSDLHVVHRNYDRSPEGQEKKRARDFRLLELDLRDRPDHPFVLFNLGMTYLYGTKDYEVAAQYLRRSLERSNPTDSIVRKAYAMLCQARTCLQEWDAAVRANEEGRCHYPDDAELLFQAAQLYQRIGRWDQARLSLERLLASRDDPHYRSVDAGLRTYRARHELALLFRRLGDPAHSARVLMEVAAQHPDYVPARLDLAQALLDLGRLNEAGAALDALPEDKNLQEAMGTLRARIARSSP
jgi:glycosyltransferase involved in cell wall biosynthesis